MDHILTETMINMSSNLVQSTMQVMVDSQPDLKISNDMLRTWFITVRVVMDDQEMELDTVMASCKATANIKQLTVEPLGMVDSFCSVYLVKENKPVSDMMDISLEFSILPKFNPIARSLYKLDTNLAQFVGRQFLSKPKYALTFVHDYVKEKNLKTRSNIICDETFKLIFGRPWLKLSDIWTELSRHVKIVPEEMVVVNHKLTEFVKTSSSSLPVMVDEKSHLFPVSWSLRGQNRSLGFLALVRSEIIGHKHKGEKRLKRPRSL